MNRMSMTLTIVSGMATVILVPAAATAVAAPSGAMSTNDVVNQLQTAGNSVVVNKIGNGAADSCMVMSVRPVAQRPLAPSHPVLGVRAQQPRTTFHVSLHC